MLSPRSLASSPMPQGLADRQAQPALAELLDLSDQGTLVVDDSQRVVHINAAMCDLLGVTAREALTVAALDVQLGQRLPAHEPRRKPLQRLIYQLEKEGAAGWTTLRMVQPQLQILQIKAQRMTNGHIAVFGRDVTQAEELDRRRHEFLSTAAHEIRSPLASVFGYAELLLKRSMAPAKQKELLGIIHRQSALLVSLINELLDLSRIEARRGLDFNRQRCSLAALVDQSLDGWFMAGDPRTVNVLVRHEDVSAWVDPDKTRQAVVNLLSNAYKYSPQGGDIEMETLTKSLNDRLWAGICVRDFGMGMSAAQIERVFEKFYRANPSGSIPGTGLGMSLVKEITELQDGHVQVESQPGQGTAVTLWFPARQDAVKP